VPGGTCPVCGGKQKVEVTLPSQICPQCLGKGEALQVDAFPIQKGIYLLCSGCRGTGWVIPRFFPEDQEEGAK
jgi:DnaJ-class molecular chaperone